ELVKRAQELIPGTTSGQVAEALADGYTAAEIDRALDEVPEHNRKSGNLPVKGWGWIRRTLANFRKQGGAPPKREPPAPPPPARKPAATPEPLAPVTREELADRGPSSRQEGYLGRFNRLRLGGAVRNGQVSPELLGTIPADLLAAPEVAAAGPGA